MSCGDINDGCWIKDWKFNHGKVGNHQGYLKSNNIINLSIKKMHDNSGYVAMIFNLLLVMILFKR